MNARVIIRPAAGADQEAICRLRTGSILETVQGRISGKQSRRWVEVSPTEVIADRIVDGCVLVGETGGRIIASNSLDLDGGKMAGLYVAPAFQRQGIGKRMVVEIERLAIRFGITGLLVDAPTPAVEFFRTCRYLPRTGIPVDQDPRVEVEVLSMERKFPRRQTRYADRIRGLLHRIGIAADYGRIHRLQLQPECCELATIGHDALGREQMLQPEAANAFYALRNAAAADGITLQVASGFRSVDYQATIIERKRRAGQPMAAILKVSAAPGYSEHHTGRAIDITTPGTQPLEPAFETTPAFEWLTGSAHEFGFRMSYPRNNRHGIAYEPWHWAWTG